MDTTSPNKSDLNMSDATEASALDSSSINVTMEQHDVSAERLQQSDNEEEQLATRFSEEVQLSEEQIASWYVKTPEPRNTCKYIDYKHHSHMNYR